MEKKIQTIRMFPEDAQKLKIWAAEKNKYIGDVIHDMIQKIEFQGEERQELLKQAGADYKDFAGSSNKRYLGLMNERDFYDLLQAIKTGEIDEVLEEKEPSEELKKFKQYRGKGENGE